MSLSVPTPSLEDLRSWGMSFLTSMVAELGSVAQPTTGTQRSTRHGHGLNSQDAQLDKLSDVLTAATYQAKKRLAPSEGLLLSNNVLAPVQKRRHKNRKLTLPPPVTPQPRQQYLPNIDPRLLTPSPISQQIPSAISQEAVVSSPPETTPRSCQQSPPNIDPRLGFFPPSTASHHSPSPASCQNLLAPTIAHQTRSTVSYQTPSTIKAVVPSPGITLLTHSLLTFTAAPRLAPAPQVDASDSESEENEDDRTAHQLLRETPVTPVVTSDPPVLSSDSPILPYDHEGFSAPKPSRIHCVPSTNVATPPLPPPPPPAAPLLPPGPEENSHTLGSYPPQWQEVICCAKQAFRAYIASKNGFPDAVTGVKEAREYLDEALAVHLESRATVKPGYRIDQNMIMLVYAESWLLHSQLKTDI